MNGLRRLGPVALAAALHASVPCAAWAEAPKPSGVAKQGQDIVARGQALFEDQQYEESIQTLSGALVRPSNTKQQKIEIYRLLALNYITLAHKEEAEGAVRGLLSLEPTYELPQRESPRFRDFFAAVKVKWDAEGRPGLVKEAEGPPAPVTMKHSSPSQATARTQVSLTAALDDPQSRVAKVVLFYRGGSDAKFEQTPAALVAGHVTAAIPSDAVKPPIVEYYFEGLDKGGLPVVSRGDAAAPLRIAISEKAGAWVVPTVIAGALVVVVGGVLGGLAAGGVFNKSGAAPGGPGNPGGPSQPGQSTVNVSVGSSSLGIHW
jgi:hypothetical protein